MALGTGNAAVGSAKATDVPTMLEASCPEYFVTHIGKAERICGGCVRLYACVIRGDHLEPVYSAIWPVESLLMRKALLDIVGTPALEEATAH